VKGVTGESFVLETLIPPEGIPPLCDDQGLRAAILDWLPTLDKSGVVVRQTGGRDPHRGIQILGVPAGGSQPTDAGPRVPPAALSPLDKGKGAASSSSAPGGFGRSEGVRRHRLRRVDGSFVTYLPLDSEPLRSVRGQLAGPRRSAPRPRARRGMSVLHRHHHLACHRHPRGSSSKNSSRGSGRPASRVAGRFRAPSKCSSLFFGLVIISTSINPSFAYQGLLPLCSQSRSQR
jgi:hypothetical protein